MENFRRESISIIQPRTSKLFSQWTDRYIGHIPEVYYIKFAPVAANKLSWHLLLDAFDDTWRCWSADYNSTLRLETRHADFYW